MPLYSLVITTTTMAEKDPLGLNDLVDEDEEVEEAKRSWQKEWKNMKEEEERIIKKKKELERLKEKEEKKEKERKDKVKKEKAKEKKKKVSSTVTLVSSRSPISAPLPPRAPSSSETAAETAAEKSASTASSPLPPDMPEYIPTPLDRLPEKSLSSLEDIDDFNLLDYLEGDQSHPLLDGVGDDIDADYRNDDEESQAPPPAATTEEPQAAVKSPPPPAAMEEPIDLTDIDESYHCLRRLKQIDQFRFFTNSPEGPRLARDWKRLRRIPRRLLENWRSLGLKIDPSVPGEDFKFKRQANERVNELTNKKTHDSLLITL